MQSTNVAVMVRSSTDVSSQLDDGAFTAIFAAAYATYSVAALPDSLAIGLPISYSVPALPASQSSRNPAILVETSRFNGQGHRQAFQERRFGGKS